MIRVPESVNSEQIQAAHRTILKKKGTDTTDVRLVKWKEGDSLQVLHTGPYNEVGPVYEELHSAALVGNIALQLPGHEIYLSDPRRSAPEKLRTIVRKTIAGESPRLYPHAGA